MSIAITERDRALIRAAWSLGAATHATLRDLVSPDTQADTLRRRLRHLHRERYLTQTRHVGPAGCIWLYGAGARTRRSGGARSWRPGVAQLEHTLAVGEAVVALTRVGFAAPVEVTGWQGESELRSWAVLGEPFPDARVTWRVGEVESAWLVELDRGTESRAAWRRKLVRYLMADLREPVLALTTSFQRANALAVVAADVGVDVLATTLEAVRRSDDPEVIDATGARRYRLSAACVVRASLAGAPAARL